MPWELRYYYPEVYFSKETAENYEKSRRMKQVQQEMTAFAAKLLKSRRISKGRVLDVGCGTGFSTEVLKEKGYSVVGIDVSQPMLDIAKAKGLQVKKADMRSIPFPDESLSAIVCISALQWITGKSREEIIANYQKTASEFYRVLKKKGVAVVQFYPKTKEETRIVERAFKKAGFKKSTHVFMPGTREEKVFWVLEKD